VVAEGGKPSAAEADGSVRIAPERQTSETIDGERKTVTALLADIGCEGNCYYAPAQKELMLVLRPNLFFGVRYYWLLSAESHLTRRLFAGMLRRIAALPSPAG
jgi:hypothetical protein